MRDRPSESSPLVRVELKRADAAELVSRDPVLASSEVVLAMGSRAQEVLAQGIVRRYADRVVVFQAGEEGDSLFVVLAGEVRLLARRDADTVELGVVSKGGVFGEAEVLTGSAVRHGSALAHGEVDLVELPRAALVVGGAVPSLLRAMLAGVLKGRQRVLDEMTDFLNRW